MDYRAWIDNFKGFAGIYSFDLLPDGSYSEIRLMAVNRVNEGILKHNPDAPAFYPGIPYRYYWSDINFEGYVYKSCTTGIPLYSYVNAHGMWIRGFYLPITEPGTCSADAVQQPPQDTAPRTLYCLYILTITPQMDSDAMSKRPAEVSEAVMNISIRLHETQDFYQAMAKTVKEIQKMCNSDVCALYTVDSNSRKCEWLSEYGPLPGALNALCTDMERTPYEVALAWEKDLADSDCLMLEDLKVVEERDPVWYKNLHTFGIRNLILYEVRYNKVLVGFLWAANFDTAKMLLIKETLEMTTFLIGAVIANHQLVSRLEEKSTVDALTQVSNRNALNERVEAFVSGAASLPSAMGVAYADLNGLKSVNDLDGHDAGDKLLTRAAALLKIAFGDDEIYRAGGDEFVILCPGSTKEKLAEQVSQLRAIADNTTDISFAVGSVFCTGSYDIRQAMQTADERMYADKEAFYRQHPEKDRRRQK